VISTQDQLAVMSLKQINVHLLGPYDALKVLSNLTSIKLKNFFDEFF
jgi:hypothetical protein